VRVTKYKPIRKMLSGQTGRDTWRKIEQELNPIF